ncbi:TraU family protein [Hahella ganghwensis]|uniref:TraU family protein n=1 Tax=Hahella ganghwensis TaxID=286420 RepID=UPI000375CE58|nr:TraU family protein [Hahella ganghwensis]
MNSRMVVCLFLLFIFPLQGHAANENNNFSLESLDMPDIQATDSKVGSIDGLPTSDQFTTFDIVEITGQQIPDCMDYCFVGVCVHWQFAFPAGINIILSPKIRHYLPEYIVQTHPEVGEEPWWEWSKVFAPAEKEAQSLLVSLMGVDFSGGHEVVDVEYDSQDRETLFKEASVIGHPLSLLPKILTTNGEFRPVSSLSGELGDVGLQGSNNSDDSGDIWCNWEEEYCDDGPDTGTDQDLTLEEAFDKGSDAAIEYIQNFGVQQLIADPRITRLFNVVDAANSTRDQFESIIELADLLEDIQSVADSVTVGVGINGELKTERLLCDTPIYPFVPYYLSTMDSFFWRNGWPITDIEHAVDVLNPFTSEAVKKDSHEWGPLFPRHGFLQTYHDYKTAGVMAARAVDVAVEEGGYRIRIPPSELPSSDEYRALFSPRWTGGKWSEVYPDPSDQCYSSVAYKGDVIDSGGTIGDGKNAWTFWRQYECCMNFEGNYVETVNIDDICLL